MKRIVVVSDLQCPDEDTKAVKSLCNFVKAWKPDELFCVGDEADQPEPSRWNKGMAGEFSGTLQAGLDRTHEVMASFKEALGNKPFHVSRSNHVDRVETYVRRYAPALNGLRALNIEDLLGYEDLGITYHRKPYEFAPGWVLAHGDEGSMLQTAGGTALSLARKIGKSVVCGHTHRAGIQAHSETFLGKSSRTLYGVECGHLMNMSKAKYLKAGAGNWQQAFGILYVDGRNVLPQLVYTNPGGSFVVEGKVYRP